MPKKKNKTESTQDSPHLDNAALLQAVRQSLKETEALYQRRLDELINTLSLNSQHNPDMTNMLNELRTANAHQAWDQKAESLSKIKWDAKYHDAKSGVNKLEAMASMIGNVYEPQIRDLVTLQQTRSGNKQEAKPAKQIIPETDPKKSQINQMKSRMAKVNLKSGVRAVGRFFRDNIRRDIDLGSQENEAKHTKRPGRGSK